MTDDTSALIQQVREARAAAEGDSNDNEIAALQCALSEALSLLGIDPKDLNKPRRVPQVVVIENPDEDPGWFVYGGKVDLMIEDLEHDSWVTLVWSKGNTGGPPEVAHGPYGSAQEALEKAELLRQQMEGAEGRHTFMAGYTPTINVVPVYADEEEHELTAQSQLDLDMDASATLTCVCGHTGSSDNLFNHIASKETG